LYLEIGGCSDFLSFSALNDQLLVHGRENGDEAFVFTLVEDSLDHVRNILQVLLMGEVAIRLHLTSGIKELKLFIIDVKKGVLNSLDDWGINHITGMESALINFHGKNILCLEDDLSGSVLTWFGSGCIGNLAWESLDQDKRTWLKSVGISLLAQGGTSVGVLELLVLG